MKYHHDGMIATKSFLNSVENPEQNVNNRIDRPASTRVSTEDIVVTSCYAVAFLYRKVHVKKRSCVVVWASLIFFYVLLQ